MNNSKPLGFALLAWCAFQFVLGLCGKPIFAHGLRKIDSSDDQYGFYMVLYALGGLAGLVIALVG